MQYNYHYYHPNHHILNTTRTANMSFTSGLLGLLATAHELGQSKSEMVPNPKRIKLNKSISKPCVAPTSLDSVETKAMPVIEPEKMAANRMVACSFLLMVWYPFPTPIGILYC